MRKLKCICIFVISVFILAVNPEYTPLTDSNNQVVYAASVKLNKSKATIYTGNTYQLKLKGATGKVKWNSSNKKIATVTNKGLVKAIGKGSAEITATYKLKVYKCKITVKEPSLTKTSLQLEPGDIESISLKGASKNVKWKSSDTDVVSVDEDGNIEALEVGTAKITATYAESTYTCKVTVKKEEQGKMTPEEIYETCAKSVVQVNAGDSLGSGFFIEENVVVTNYHVIENATELNVVLNNGAQRPVQKVIGYSESLDLALLEVEANKPVLEMNTHGIKVGETTYAIGSSLGLSGTFSNGMITCANRTFEGVNYIQTNTAISHGNSGGPLLNEYGEVMGITTSSFTEGQNLNLAIEISQVKKVDRSHPCTVEEYLNSKKGDTGIGSGSDNDSKYDLIYEDENCSSSPLTAQEVPLNVMLGGCITDDSEIDYYKVNITKSGSYMISYTTDSAYDVGFGIIDEKTADVIKVFTPTSTEVDFTSIYLDAGTYYFCGIGSKDCNYYTPVIYIFMISPL